MEDSLKNAWDRRSDVVKSIPQIGIFSDTPACVPEDRDEYVCLSIQEEADNLRTAMRSLIVHKQVPNCDPEKILNYLFPHSVTQESKIYKELSLSPFGRRVMFGHKLEKNLTLKIGW